MSKKLYVGNLPFSATEEDLRNAFAAFSPTSASIVMDRETGRSRGFAFVEVEDADSAISTMSGADLGGRRLVVSEARERESRGPRHGGFGNPNGGYNNQGGGFDRRDNKFGRHGGGFNRRDNY